MLPPHSSQQAIERTVREEWGRILAALTKQLGDIQLAEDCLQEALISALHHWQKNGLPKSPAAWLITTARRKAIDKLRRDQNFASKQGDIAYLIELEASETEREEEAMIPDQRLEMIFTCCHPAIDAAVRVPLTLRTLGGLSTEDIARAFLTKPETMAQRLVRAKKKIKLAGIPYVIPEADALPERLNSVLQVIYLIFNEGYSASAGDALTRVNLSDEAIRLGRILHSLLPEETEVAGLLALMLIHDSRCFARTDEAGNLISLEQQNRQKWDQSRIREGDRLLKAALVKKRLGPYQLQAAISAVHAHASNWEETDWAQIEALYGLLEQMQPSPIIRLNRAVAVSYARSVEEALNLLEAIGRGADLEKYQPFHAARADFYSRMGDQTSAGQSFRRAIELSDNEAERAFLQRKWAALTGPVADQ